MQPYPFKYLLAVCLLVLAGFSAAALDLYDFQNPEQEARYRQLVAELRCPMCLNTNLVGSDAPIAEDLREQVYLMLLAGHTDEEVVAFMRARYGDFILYRPRLNAATALLWFGPALMLLFGALLIWRHVVRVQKTPPSALTESERARLAAWLEKTQP